MLYQVSIGYLSKIFFGYKLVQNQLDNFEKVEAIGLLWLVFVLSMIGSMVIVLNILYLKILVYFIVYVKSYFKRCLIFMENQLDLVVFGDEFFGYMVFMNMLIDLYYLLFVFF